MDYTRKRTWRRQGPNRSDRFVKNWLYYSIIGVLYFLAFCGLLLLFAASCAKGAEADKIASGGYFLIGVSLGVIVTNFLVGARRDMEEINARKKAVNMRYKKVKYREKAAKRLAKVRGS